MALKQTFARLLAGIVSKSYYFTQFVRLVMCVYDNECNADMQKMEN